MKGVLPQPIRDKTRSYKAFMLRLWPASIVDLSTWRASVEEAASGRKYTFTSLSALFSFLLKETQTEVDKGDSERRDGSI